MSVRRAQGERAVQVQGRDQEYTVRIVEKAVQQPSKLGAIQRLREEPVDPEEQGRIQRAQVAIRQVRRRDPPAQLSSLPVQA